jgi:riboflavin biosynthesis pyrimidine reductase
VATSAVQQRIDALYPGSSPQLCGVTHVCSAVRVTAGAIKPEVGSRGACGAGPATAGAIKPRLHVIKIGEQAPKSERDFFVLNLARAQCDAILTTAQVVRAEPKLSHRLQGDLAAELAQYRREVLGKVHEPVCAILTRSGHLPAEHRVFSDPLRNVVLTLRANVASLEAALGSRAQVVGFDALDAKVALGWLRAEGARGILVEAGPSTASVLYEAPSCVEQLRLSVCEAPIAPAAIGGMLPADPRLFAGMTRRSSSVFDEVSGLWRFEFWATRA